MNPLDDNSALIALLQGLPGGSSQLPSGGRQAPSLGAPLGSLQTDPSNSGGGYTNPNVGVSATPSGDLNVTGMGSQPRSAGQSNPQNWLQTLLQQLQHNVQMSGQQGASPSGMGSVQPQGSIPPAQAGAQMSGQTPGMNPIIKALLAKLLGGGGGF